jgi:hypothetical protein
MSLLNWAGHCEYSQATARVEGTDAAVRNLEFSLEIQAGANG